MHPPNPIVLEAQARVCTGPHQSRPLGQKSDDPRPEPVLDHILDTLAGKNPDDGPVSDVQMGAFFIAMALRRNYEGKTTWSHAEIQAFEHYNTRLQQTLPPDLQFILYSNRECQAQTQEEIVVITALKTILKGEHLPYKITRQMCEAILTDQVRGSLKGAALIGQRMNRETYDEVRGYYDSVFPPENIHSINVPSLTHFGQPYNGSTRYFKPTLFVAAIRAALGRPTLLHGVDTLPPKWGITEEQILTALGCRTNLSLSETARCIEDPAIGFAYISQREFAPNAYAARDLRVHIAKRPAWSATEKAQQLFVCPGNNHIVMGYYHAGYEEPLLQLAWERGFQSAIAVKGEEGTSHFALRLGKPSGEDRKAVNFVQGFHRINTQRHEIAVDADPKTYGFDYSENLRPETVSTKAFAQLGLAALSGEKSHIYDRLILNTALTDHLLGLEPDPHLSIEKVRETINSGRALAQLKAYIQASQ